MPEILGVRVDNLNLREARAKVREFLSSGGQHKIFTPNPEMAVKAHKDKKFQSVLNRGQLNLCDGFGLCLFSGTPRITGADFILDIGRIAAEQGKSVFLLGSGSNDIAARAAKKMGEIIPGLKIAGFSQGPDFTEADLDTQADKIKHDEVVQKINESGAQVLFVAFGMGKQEKWIDEYLPKMPQIKIAKGVGGTFDFLAGVVPRAPRLMRQLGLEWLYRLFKQPKRFWRIFNATAVFTSLVVLDKFKKKNYKAKSI